MGVKTTPIFGSERVLTDNGFIKDDRNLSFINLGNIIRDWSQLTTPTTKRYSIDQQNQIVKELNLTPAKKKEFFGL